MITEQQQDLAVRHALGELTLSEQAEFGALLRTDPELREFVRSLQTSTENVALSAPQVNPSPALKEKILGRLQGPATIGEGEISAGLLFLTGSNEGWKPLPIPGAFIKLLSLQQDRGYAVLLGKLDRGVRYPAHTNAGPEDFYILTGDLHVSGKVLGPGDFHHADAGSQHAENYSVDGCTLLAVLTTDDPLVRFACA